MCKSKKNLIDADYTTLINISLFQEGKSFLENLINKNLMNWLFL